MTNYLYTQVNPPQPNLHADPTDVAQPNTLESNVPFELLTLGQAHLFTLRILAPTPKPLHFGVRNIGLQLLK